MSTLDDVVRGRTALSEGDLEALHVLLGEWQILADLSFADLVLWVALRDGRGIAAAAQLRPTTGPTVLPEDLVGLELGRDEAAAVVAALDAGRFTPAMGAEVGVSVDVVPVRRSGKVVAAIERHRPARHRGGSSALEEAYLASADDLARMIAEGRFPFPAMFSDPESAPRVGDGFLRLEADGTVAYASPNAQSAYRRLGHADDLVGRRLGEVTRALLRSDDPMDDTVGAVAGGRAPRTVEVEADGASVLLRSIPLQPGGRRVGALVLLRDVTDLRRRERLMATKDATIREVHHRVKNNLQTVAALLRLQARRLDSETARAALEEAVRRVGSIAVVHETLSQTPDEVVAFDEIADRLLAMVLDVGVDGDGEPVAARRAGTFGILTADVATPLAMALTEVLQNAVAHGLRGRPGGSLQVTASRGGGRLRVQVLDDGRGLPARFDPEESGRLGLQIVRTLVVGELGGTFDLAPARGGGTSAVIDVPLPGDETPGG